MDFWNFCLMFDSFPRPCWCLNFLWRYGEQQKRTREARPKWAVSAFGRAKKVEERSEARKEEGKASSQSNTMAHERHISAATRRTDGHRKQKPEWRGDGQQEASTDAT